MMLQNWPLKFQNLHVRYRERVSGGVMQSYGKSENESAACVL